VSLEQLDKVRTGLIELAKQKPARKHADVWKMLASEQGITTLVGKRCPKEIRVRSGARRVILWSGSAEHDLGSSRIPNTPCGEILWDVAGRGDIGPDMKPRCYEHDGGFLVRVRNHHGCEGDTYIDQFAYIAAP